MFQFVTDSVDGLGKKRKAAQRACEQCRARRKRCDHSNSKGKSRPAPALRAVNRGDTLTHGTVDVPSRDSTQRPASPDSSSLPRQVSRVEPETEPENTITPQTQLRFVGELSPTALFRANRAAQEGAGLPDSHSVGVWVERSRRAGRNGKHMGNTNVSSSTSLVSHRPIALQALLPYLSDTCSSSVPPEDDYEALKSIYLAKIHPICPIVIESSLTNNANRSERSCLQQALCILASQDPTAKPYLHLPGSEEVLSSTEFGRRLADIIRTSIDLGFVTNDLVLVQVTTLMALYVDGPTASTTSARYCSEAVHHAQNLGLHLSRPDSPSQNILDKLFSCVWAIDRLNAAVNGRPVLMHDWDLGVSLTEIISNSVPAFRLFLKTCTLLDHVIFQYRPQYRHQDNLAGAQIPTFEETVITCEAKDIDSALLASLELFYHAVAILSHRPSSTTQASIPAAQRYSAERITSIVANEFSFRLSMWILTPYAVSLSLSTAYRELRNTLIPNNRRRAHAAFQVNCQLLEHLSPFFWSARAMAELAKETLAEMERVRSKMITTQDGASGEQMQSRQKNKSTGKATNQELEHETDAAHENTVDWPATPNPCRDPLADIQYDPSPFLSIPDVDVFTCFDPDFDLGNVDSVLQGNLDLSLPWT